ncbi:endonuclease VII domain-containing protein [Streptomyces zaomyceticus]|uniref:endonuclease VII domain-containing protein n=1 Tax=Streptomyces zaomyceticus TaxID=68286 RepID=UPI0037AE0E10
MTQRTEPAPARGSLPPGCLDHVALAARMGWASPSVARTLSSRARKNREAGTPRPGDLPEPDGYAGQRPYWTEETVAAWDDARPSTVRAEDVGEGRKRCSKCQEVKPLEEFNTYTDRRQNPPAQRPLPKCKPCATAAAIEWLESNPELRRAADRAYKSRPEVKRRKRARQYGLTAEELEAMETAQEGRCLICGDPGDPLVVDHCHVTGKVRGLLCTLCNLGLGAFRDQPRRMAAAMAYLVNSTL